MSHLPPKPDFDYPVRYPAEPRHFPRQPPPAVYTPTPERYPPRERHVYPPPRSPPRSRAAVPVDTYVPARSVDAYRSTTRPPPPPMDAYPSSYYNRRDDERHREREYERRGDDYRPKARDDHPRDRERDRDRRRDDDTRKGYDGERKDRDTSREQQWSRQRDEERERREREWARQREDRERQEREWARLRDEDRRYGRDRVREVEPERKWVPRMSRSPPRRIVPAKPPEQSPVPSRARSPAPASPARRAPATPLPAASRAGSPYKVERSRPLHSRSPPYEVRLGNHSISVPRNSARVRRDPSPRDNDRDRRQPSLRRSRSPDRSRREVRRDVSRGSRIPPSNYRGRERRSPRRRSYSPISRQRRESPRPTRRRTPSPPSRSRTRSPTRTPPPKRHVLPPLKSPSRPPPPPTGPRIRPVQTSPKPDADGDVEMEEPSEIVPAASVTGPSTSPAEVPASSPVPVLASISPRPHSSALSPVSPAAKVIPAIPSLPSKPETDRKPTYPRRRSRSPPTGPRHHLHVSTPSNKSPAQSAHAGPNLPSKPDWVRRNTGREAGKQEATASVPAPAASTVPSEPGVFVPVIPPYQPKPSITADIEADIARVRAHRTHIENEYIKIAKNTRKALNDLMIADIDLKNAESRRAVSSAQLEKARAGKLGIDFIAGS